MPHPVSRGQGALVRVEDLEGEDEALGDDLAAELVRGHSAPFSSSGSGGGVPIGGPDGRQEAGDVHHDAVLADAAVHGLAALPLHLDVDDALQGLVHLLDDLGQLLLCYVMFG